MPFILVHAPLFANSITYYSAILKNVDDSHYTSRNYGRSTCDLSTNMWRKLFQVPDFDSASYSSKLAENLVSMRGRELPGFTSARLLMGSVFVDLENLRSEVLLIFICVNIVFLVEVFHYRLKRTCH